MKRLLHTNSKIFFNNPYVLRIELGEASFEEARREYRTIIRSAYKRLQGTWGHSAPTAEHVRVKFDHPKQKYPNQYEGMTQNEMMNAIMNPDWKMMQRAYLCFANEEDALQFRLSCTKTCLHVSMWPETIFTIHESVEE